MAVPPTARVRNHWYWRPGWHVGTRFYAWHITVADQPEVVALAGRYRAVLGREATLDVIPDQWLHVTMQGLAFVDQIDRGDLDAIVARASERCAALAPLPLRIGVPYVDPESVQIAVQPAEQVRNLRAVIRAAIADVWGDDRVPEPVAPYTPHLSLAYINADGPAEPLADVVAAGPEITATLTVDHCELIVLNRDHGMYVWEPYATVRLGR